MHALWLILAACGGGGDDGVDAVTGDPMTVVVTGTATERSSGGSDPVEGVLIEAYANNDEATVVTSAMTDAQGNYTLTITAAGALDGYLKATKAGLLDTYLYPPGPLTENFDGASVNMLSSGTFDLLANLLCRANQESSMGTVAVLVNDASDNPVAGATVASSPAATKTCYDAPNGGLPSSSATATSESGIGYLFNVTGEVTVSAMGSGTFQSHGVKARAGAFTTTLVRP